MTGNWEGEVQRLICSYTENVVLDNDNIVNIT